jgi:hypothetical protein
MVALLFLWLLFLQTTDGWRSIGTALRTWSLPPAVGTLSCMDSTNFGLVGGTSRGYVATFPVESNVAATTRLLSDGQALLHVHSEGTFVAGSFYDAALGKYVVRMKDLQQQYSPFTVYHPTHVLGGGFMRMHMDLCYFSLSIDGFYVVSSVRRGQLLKVGRLCDDMRGYAGTPTCVSVVDDGMVAVGTLEGRLYLLDVEKQAVNSEGTTFIPRAVHALRLRGVKSEYLMCWTSVDGDVVTGHTSRRVCDHGAVAITTASHENVGHDESLVNIKTSERQTMTIQSESGKTFLRRPAFAEKSARGCWLLPSPCLFDLVWHTNEKRQVSLLRIEEDRA